MSIQMMPPWYQVRNVGKTTKLETESLDLEMSTEQISQTRKMVVLHAPNPAFMGEIPKELLPTEGSIVWIPEYCGIDHNVLADEMFVLHEEIVRIGDD